MPVTAGDRLELEPGLVLEILYPPPEPVVSPDANANNSSLVVKLTWQQASFLLTGDLEAEGEQWLLDNGKPIAATVLKLGHHGSDSSTTSNFLSAVAPSYAIISVGADNRFDHPAQSVLDRLDRQGNITLLRTDEQGAIDFVTDGQHLWIQTER